MANQINKYKKRLLACAFFVLNYDESNEIYGLYVEQQRSLGDLKRKKERAFVFCSILETLR